MPEIEVRIYQTENGQAPLLKWLNGEVPAKVRLKCLERIERLRSSGHDLRPPHAKYLGQQIYELRVRRGRVNYRMLYFFHGGKAVLSHGLTKEREVPRRDIDLAVRRMRAYQANPERHTYGE